MPSTNQTVIKILRLPLHREERPTFGDDEAGQVAKVAYMLQDDRQDDVVAEERTRRDLFATCYAFLTGV